MHRGRGLLEDGVGVGWKSHPLTLSFKFGKLSSVVDGGKSLPQEQGQDAQEDHGSNDPQKDANVVRRRWTDQDLVVLLLVSNVGNDKLGVIGGMKVAVPE